MAPRPQAPPGTSKLQSLQTPSVAVELLVSSALRMLWPADAWAKGISGERWMWPTNEGHEGWRLRIS